MPPTPSTTRRAQARILLVDDDEIVMAGLLATLSREGYELVVARNGYAALDELEREPFQLLITDLKMPGLSGIGLLERARRHFPKTPVIMISGFPSRNAADEALCKGAARFLVKPVDSETLRETVRHQLAAS